MSNKSSTAAQQTELREAVADIFDGSGGVEAYARSLRNETGLSEARCREIAELFSRVAHEQSCRRPDHP